MSRVASVTPSLLPAAGAPPHAVHVEQVTKRFAGNVTAVDRVSLTVPSGEFVCLLGPSGSGKTTLLRMIGGFEEADEGRVFLLGEDVTRLPPARRRTNMVFQQHALFPHLNVYDNIAFGPRMRRVPMCEIDRRVAEVLHLVRLPGFESRRVDQLSGGQRQRIAIARAIINDPAVLLLDEPLGALDLRLRVELQNELRRLQRSLGSPFIVVTHDQGEAMAMSDRIAVINAGRIEQIGTPDEIYNRPASLFVAQFIGHTNLLEGHICASAGNGAYTVDVRGIPVPCRASAGLPTGRRLVLSVREEHVDLEVKAPSAGGADFRVAATVIDRRFLGSQVKYSLRLSNGLCLVAEMRADGTGAAPEMGAKVQLGWRVSRVPAFESG
jgi:spermidine/putrescine transport system ATP-binding protein